ncbi:helix-turn-helix domain-containing protein [Pseudomonas mandelii]|uniref:XRE family transcriptional regulator n=1 Tax=Pseudomonas mandelii TaxID=75612 RepID=A0A502IGC6_9PSED|nr:helix-turn-helix transcriptional regulator [Pseudomonas mandelii]TPG84742.1 XRE family transcriptional regulator [Pseudomonas mandelii]
MSSDVDKKKAHFGIALRAIRKSKDLRMHEVYSKATGRTYYSALELGHKSPTLAKIDEIAAALEVHPLALLLLTYAQSSDDSMLQLLLEARMDLAALGLWTEEK